MGEMVMIDTNEITHGGQAFVKINTLPYVKFDGTVTHLMVWQSNCADCGAEFTFTTPATASEFKSTRRCQAHRKPGKRATSLTAPNHAPSS